MLETLELGRRDPTIGLDVSELKVQQPAPQKHHFRHQEEPHENCVKIEALNFFVSMLSSRMFCVDLLFSNWLPGSGRRAFGRPPVTGCVALKELTS